METKNCSRLLALVMLMTIVEAASFKPAEFRTEAQMYYDQIPAERRDVFIRYQLSEGLRQQGKMARMPKMFDAMMDVDEEFGAPPEGFATNLYAWFVDEHSLEASDVQVLVEDHDVSLPTTDCYDPREAPPPSFSADLLSWAKDEFEMEDPDVQTLVESSYVCMPSKGCYNPNDIGGHCCPF